MKKKMLVAAMAAGLVLMVGTGSAHSRDAGERVWIGFHQGHQHSLQRSLASEGAQVHHQFGNMRAVVATLPRASLERIKASGAVEYVRPDPRRYPMADLVPYGIDLVQARDVWDADRDGILDAGAPTGAGVTVCVIDSGLSSAHSDFTNVDVIGGYPAGWDSDRCGHGTHVAGTIAADLNGSGVVGVSPGQVSLYILKVFGKSTTASCQWSYASDLVDAAYRCQEAGASVINMSLGGPFADPVEREAFQDLLEKGVLSIAAAGNAGNTSLSYPASYDSVISVAGVDSQKNHYSSSQVNAPVEIAAPAVGVLSTVGYSASAFETGGLGFMSSAMGETVEKKVSGDIVDGGLCLDALETFENAIVLCQRGQITFADKALNAQQGGARGVAIYNNAPGGFSGTFGASDHGVLIPGISLSLEDGVSILERYEGQSAMLSTIFTYPSTGFDTYSGTSMATPHVAGAAAVLWSDNRDLTATEVRNALSAGAEDLGEPGRDYMFGNGLLQLSAALEVARSGEIPELPEPPPPPPPPPSDPLVNGRVVKLDPIPAGEWARYYIEVPDEAAVLRVEITAGAVATGDADLYVRYEEVPSLTDHDCRPWQIGSNEVCEFRSVAAGRYYVWVQAYPLDGDVSGVSLVATWAQAPRELVVTSGGAHMRPTHALAWEGGGAEVDVWLNGRIVHTGVNAGQFSMGVSVVLGDVAWQVCNAGTDYCSEQFEMRR